MAQLSIIVRLYNGIEYLEETLQSVVAQTFSNWNLCVGVNGHGESGGEVYQKAVEIQRRLGDGRIEIVNYPGVRGGAEALNALVADAKAPWVAILDADDKWHKDKLQVQWLFLQKYPYIDVIGTWCQYFGDRYDAPCIPGEFISNEFFRHTNPMINSSVMIRRELAEFSSKWYGLDDYELWIRLSLQGKVFFNIPFILIYHRIYATSHFNASKKQDVDGLRREYFG